MSTVVSFRQSSGSLPVQGRIRMGVKHPTKKYPQSLSTFRFTSQDKPVIEALAALYGGEPCPWNGEWEVITKTKSLPVLLPPDPLGDTPRYELWSGGGRLRACDGEQCEMMVQTPDGYDSELVQCQCVKNNLLECKPTTRLMVILREIPFGGAWMLSTKSFYASQELPGMVAMVRMAQARGLTMAKLRLEQRESRQVGAATKKFVVPVLQPDVPLEALVQGKGQVGAYNAGELEAGTLDE